MYIFIREEAHQFELKLKKNANVLEQGIEVTMWQMIRTVEFGSESKDEDHFTLQGSQVYLKLDRRGEFLAQAALTFSMKGGYSQKASNRQSGEWCKFLHSKYMSWNFLSRFLFLFLSRQVCIGTLINHGNIGCESRMRGI